MGSSSLTIKSRPRMWSLTYDAEYVLRHTIVPHWAANIPHILGWCGPSRSGTTALLFLLAGHPDVDRTYFQPQKTIMRAGVPDFELYSSDSLVCMKEVFWSMVPETPYDPIDLLLKSGVPEEKITWVVTLRDPLQVFASWRHFDETIEPDMLAYWQTHSLQIFHKYKKTKIKMIPFVYELLEGQEWTTIKALLSKAGLSVSEFTNVFDEKEIARKIIPGQAADEEYFKRLIKATLERRKFIYGRNKYPLSPEIIDYVEQTCRSDYEVFKTLAHSELFDTLT